MSVTATMQRRRYELTGRVQGVGFRPAVCRLAQRLGLGGFVANDAAGAVIEVEGSAESLDLFEGVLMRELPPAARVNTCRMRQIAPLGDVAFRIERSSADGPPRAQITPDLATCAECLRELFDPASRRFRHPLITCTQCGPRYTIVQRIPYDRPATTMGRFEMCPECRREYADPADRRFHAQPICCPACGPRVWFVESAAVSGVSGRRDRSQRVPRVGHRGPTLRHEAGQPGAAVAHDSRGRLSPIRLIDSRGWLPPIRGIDSRGRLSPIACAAAALRAGRIVAIKGIGGYHLACRADRPAVVAELRRRKHRETRPLALMVPDLATARRLCCLSAADEAALRSPAAPIVLAPRRPGSGIADEVAPGCAAFGVMLPYSPIHHLLFAEGLGPLVMTSANRSAEPLIWRDDDARSLLDTLADALLAHDRPIARPVDDSVVWTLRNDVVVVRRARGYVPEPIELDVPAGDAPLLALGGELKATFCLLRGREALVSEHLGDLDHAPAWRHYLDALERLEALYDVRPARLACDLHPQYLTSRLADSLKLPCVRVQHHHAHIASVLAEHRREGPVVGIACDGTGYGTDRTVWGCELLLCRRGRFRRIGHLRPFALPGGDAAAKQTWRPAVGLLDACFADGWPEVVGRLAPQVLDRIAAAVRSGSDGGQPVPDVATWERGKVGTWERDRTPGPSSLRRSVASSFSEGQPPPAGAGVNTLARIVRDPRLSPRCSSLGRLFDAAAFLLGLCGCNSHEARAAMALEAAAAGVGPAQPLPYALVRRSGQIVLDVAPLVQALLAAIGANESPAVLAARFHETVAAMLADAAATSCRTHGVATVALSGGCFVNRLLTQRLMERLEAAGLEVLYNRLVPAGDGGIALGQAWVAAWVFAGG